MDASLLDTDLLNEVLKKKNPVVVEHAAKYLQGHGRFSISSMTRYEILRGLKEVGASSQLSRFQTFCENTTILPISDRVLDLAAELWGEGRMIGKSPQDADLIIAATALLSQRSLVTGNQSHFDWISGLKLENWRNL